MNQILSSKLGKHFVAMGAVAAAFVGAQANAAIVHSGAVNIVVPDNIDGVYLNVVTGAAGAVGPAGWDLNPYSAAAGQFNLWGATTTTWLSPSGVIGGPYVLNAGELIGPGVNFFRPGGGTNVGLQVNLNSSNNLFGFQFTNEAAGGQTQYGWIRFEFGADASTRSIVEYAYEDSGASIGAGVVPAPASAALLGLGGLVAARRRRN